MIKPEVLELFSGFGGVGIALKSMGFEVAAAVERERKPAEVYQRNHPGVPIHIASVADVDYSPYYGIYLLHGSPPCQNFSQARSKNLPAHADADVGLEMIRAAAECRPRFITLENVPGYLKSDIFREICAGLARLGYVSIVHPATREHTVYNWAELGGPQARRRLMARWVRRDSLDRIPHDGAQLTLFGGGYCWGWRLEPIARPSIGWYAAVADLLLELPDSKLAPWQQRALVKGGWLSEDGRILVGKMQHSTKEIVAANADDPSFTVTSAMQGTRALLIPKGVAPRGVSHRMDSEGFTKSRVREAVEPAATIVARRGELTALLIGRDLNQGDKHIKCQVDNMPANTITCKQGGSNYKALLIPRVGARLNDDGSIKWAKTPDEPAPTVKALGHCQHYRQLDALLSDATVKSLNPRCLARLQGFPDWFELPEVAYVAGKGIGNAVPPPMYEAIVGPMLGQAMQLEVAA